MELKIINCPHCGKIIPKDALYNEKRLKVTCPECGGQRTCKAGIRYTREGKVQRYLCRNCGYRFSFARALPEISPEDPKLIWL